MRRIEDVLPPKVTRALRVEQLPHTVDPYAVSAHWQDAPHRVLLENPGQPTALGRWSFLCVDPFLSFRSKRRQAWVGPPGEEAPVEGDPLDVLAALLQAYRPASSSWREGLPPLLGGAVGYLGYELLYLIEDVPDTGRDDPSVPDSYLLFCATVIATDGVEGRSFLVTQAFAAEADTAEELADRQLSDARARLAQPPAPPGVDQGALRARRDALRAERPRLGEQDLRAAGFEPVVTRQRYLDTVQTAKRHIYEGDIFEVCTSQRFDTSRTVDPDLLYAHLRAVNPAPFAAYLRLPELTVLSSSPERFVSLGRDGKAQTRPIKGTRPRGQTPEEDERLKQELLTSEKDHAENMMIVDLSRNDFGRVCQFGTVRAPSVCAVETYAFTHQLVSTVEGQLEAGKGAVDLIRAAFPGGSITGAPKVEAMKIIDRLEPVKRGVFSGSIGYFDFEGAMDLSIVIRTFVQTKDRLTFHVGGAIVADSEPQEEYQETLDKAHALIDAVVLLRTGR